MRPLKKAETFLGSIPTGSFIKNLKIFNPGEAEKEGLPPGSLVYTGERKTDKVTVEMIQYDEESITTKRVTDVQNVLRSTNKDKVTWINVNGLHDVKLIGRIGESLGVHPLVMEDILNTDQRPKVEVYDDFLFIVLRMLYDNKGSKGLQNEQVSFLLCKNCLISFQEIEGDVFDIIRERLRKNKGRIRKMKVDYLVYSLIDAIIDKYFSLLEMAGDRIEKIEKELAENPTERSLRSIYTMKRELILMRRSVWPLRDVVHTLEREEGDLISHDTVIYLRDLYDHTIRVMDAIETYRDMVSGLLDLYMSSISNRMNEIMQVLTIIATIFIPLTFIAGIYGMNFNTNESPWNMPELNWYLGYPLAIGAMVLITVVMVIYFKKKKWF